MFQHCWQANDRDRPAAREILPFLPPLSARVQRTRDARASLFAEKNRQLHACYSGVCTHITVLPRGIHVAVAGACCSCHYAAVTGLCL